MELTLENISDIKENVDYLVKYYRLERLFENIKISDLYVKAIVWFEDHSMYRSMRNMVRTFLIEYYKKNQLSLDNPELGNGLGRWHIQIVDDPERNIYCGQKMAWDSSFHEGVTVEKLYAAEGEAYNGAKYKMYADYSICDKCTIGYLRKRSD